MKLKDFLLEMPVKIDTIRTRKFGDLAVEIRTSDPASGQSEHSPPHIHIIWIANGVRLDVPVLISRPPNYATDKSVKFKPAELEHIVFNYVIYNYKQLLQTFNQAQLNIDPSTTYRKLQQGETI